MMGHTDTYRTACKNAMCQHELEANALINTASKLNAVKQDWTARKSALSELLEINRKMWTVLAAQALEPSNPLPREVKQNVANVAYFIFKHTLKMLSADDPKGLDVLININLNVAKGLNDAMRNKAALDKAENAPAPVAQSA